jgi:hypothetical protein
VRWIGALQRAETEGAQGRCSTALKSLLLR